MKTLKVELAELSSVKSGKAVFQKRGDVFFISDAAQLLQKKKCQNAKHISRFASPCVSA
jgi:hypothetical protein